MDNLSLIVDETIENMKYFKMAIQESVYVKPEKLYEKIIADGSMLQLLIDEIIKKTSSDVAIEIYNSLFNILIPYFYETINIDGLKLIPDDIVQKDHSILLKVYIGDTYYGNLDIINRIYKLPNIDRIREIENKVIELSPKIAEYDEKLGTMAVNIKNPKQLAKGDPNFRLNYLFNKKKSVNKLTTDFMNEYNKRQEIEQELSSLNSEYMELYNSIMSNRYDDEKLNLRLIERLNIAVDNTFIFSNDSNEETEEKMPLNCRFKGI